MGAEPLAPQDIEAWARVTGTALRRDEIEIILAMDSTYREARAADRAERKGAQ